MILLCLGGKNHCFREKQQSGISESEALILCVVTEKFYQFSEPQIPHLESEVNGKKDLMDSLED